MNPISYQDDSIFAIEETGRQIARQERTIKKLRDALKAVLLFYYSDSCGWGKDEIDLWHEITGDSCCNRDVLCDHIRKVLE